MYSKHLSEGRTNAAGPVVHKKAKAREDIQEIVVLNTAAEVVKGWLEASGDSDEEEDALPEPELRPPRLGLGAKYLPHAKVSSQLDTLERRLRAKIGKSAEQGSDEETVEEEPSRKKHKARDGTNGAAAQETEVPSSEDDEEDRGRAGAFTKMHRGAPVLEAVFQTKKKKRKKKAGKTGGAK